MDEVITLCGRELAREWIATCGMVGGSFSRSKKQPRIRSRSLAGSPTESQQQGGKVARIANSSLRGAWALYRLSNQGDGVEGREAAEAFLLPQVPQESVAHSDPEESSRSADRLAGDRQMFMPLELRCEGAKKVVSSSINKDAETINMMSEFIPNLPQELKATLSERQPSLTELQRLFIPELESLQLIFEEYKKMVQAQTEAGKNHLLQLKDLGLSKHSRKKRQYSIILSHGCCKLGCTRRVLARACST
ncbi:prorelaxin 1-like [Tamandua tetradactyla]|uniref:prorelaxin 1-like n=1 Tax=Tamandua tetradactyla TaxID=48850 RepID=UPI00405380D1